MSAAENRSSSPITVVKEIRFAVVLYGGVSLAIYINGVAQELLRMVRATAITKDDNGATIGFKFSEDELDESEKFYRDLSYLLADDDSKRCGGGKTLKEKYSAWLTGERKSYENPLATIKKREDAPVVRFVVDILSGSSAGGINGVYMAKALVDGQRLGTLEKLWKEEGDFAKLLCDEQSIFENGKGSDKIGLMAQNPPLSLLNSQRMYLKLLRAFEEMNQAEPLCSETDCVKEPLYGKSAFVDEVDLFVTMTDFWGIPVPIRLFDQLIYERRHRQNLHFRFRKYDFKKSQEFLNEFKPEFYPFLAFSARSTSSFPLAFDPMQLSVAENVIAQVQNAASEGTITAGIENGKILYENWRHSFSPAKFQDSAGAEQEIEWKERVFVDGGYLDNKPFGYAIKALEQKQSEVPVDRKLIYVEPEPDEDDSFERAAKTVPPFALQNTLAALTDLPRYETIREDLQEVLQRNRLIVRVNQLVANARRDDASSLDLSLDHLSSMIEQYRRTLNELPKGKRDDNDKPIWSTLTLGELARQHGQAVYPYYRLRVSALNDDLARMVARRAGLDEDSDYFYAVRDLVRVWRKQNFNAGEEKDLQQADSKVTPEKGTPLKFLSDFDYNYRLRRLRFVMQQADGLLTDKDLYKELKRTVTLAESPHLRGKIQEINHQFATLKQNNPGVLPKLHPHNILNELFPLIEDQVFDFHNQENKQQITLPSRQILNAIENSQQAELNYFVLRVKFELNGVLQKLRRRLWEINPKLGEPESNKLRGDLDSQIKDLIEKLGIDGLERLLGKTDKNDFNGNRFRVNYDLDDRYHVAEEIIKEKKLEENLKQIGEILQKIYNNPLDREKTGKAESLFAVAKAETREIFEKSTDLALEAAVRQYLSHFYSNFDAYDQIIYPVTYETPIGEAALVDVARISPLDATSLIDQEQEKKIQAELERRATGKAPANPESEEAKKINAAIKARELKFGFQARTKVAGGVFQAFGAFFAENWRENDILWGRLDAMERLMSIVLVENQSPSKALILSELDEQKRKETAEKEREITAKLRRNLVEALHITTLEKSDLIKNAKDKYEREQITKFETRLDFVRQKYAVERDLDEMAVIETTSRSLAVLKQVIREEEIGKLNFVKNLGFKGTSFLIGSDLKIGWMPILAALVVVFLITALPVILLGAALTVPYWEQSYFRLLIGIALIIIVYLIIFAIVFWFLKSVAVRPKQFAVGLIMKAITGKKSVL